MKWPWPERADGETMNRLPDIAKVGTTKKISLSSLTRRFRVILEESFTHESPENRGPEHRRFHEIIPCKGFKPGPGQSGPYIALYSEEPPILQLYTPRVGNAKSIWGEIKEHPGTWADFHLDQEALVFFPATPELLQIVGEMAGARRKRVLSEEQRTALIERGKVGRSALKKWQEQRVQVQNSTPNEPPGSGAKENDVGIRGSVF